MDTTLASTLKARVVDILAFPVLVIVAALLVMMVVYAWHLHKRGF